MEIGRSEYTKYILLSRLCFTVKEAENCCSKNNDDYICHGNNLKSMGYMEKKSHNFTGKTVHKFRHAYFETHFI